MESKWRQNIPNYGLGWTGATLASRFLNDPQFVITNTNRFGGACTMRVRLPSVTREYYQFDFLCGIPAGSHFPYGYAVEPDGLP